ncbi:hypothetical protein IDR97_004124 [Salmonella enterica subsp. enterica serovar Thompson]|uniref:Uncharacterized protein n=1 Tax=Salmonella virus VSiP TaxID=2301721 RepID=A0A385EG98_9CAUD|nr:hypothetical protein PF627_gp10 [Salmonella virus VSiP]AXQ70195.1 hypothetical protein vsip_10 [Salmonella virus VSiP]QFR58921.1 hypothetical protein vsia_09 [Salmonella virus VSiA]
MTDMKSIITKAWDIKETIKFMRQLPIGIEFSAWDLVDVFIENNGGDKDATVNGEWYSLWNNMAAGFSLRKNNEGLALFTRIKESSGCLPR